MRHRDQILDQFTRQAVPFSQAPSIRDSAAIEKLIELTEAGPTHRTLDVACGPGLVVLGYARKVARAEGIDATPAMLARARELQQAEDITNVIWHQGDAVELPFAAAAFDIVTCRFSIHHLLDAPRALSEMIRVTKPGGCIAVVDAYASDDPCKAAAFNAMERLRDPSTVRFRTLEQLRKLLRAVRLRSPTEFLYKLPAELEGLMRTSFPEPENIERLRQLIIESAQDDALGLGTRLEGTRYLFEYPVAMFVQRI
jgi:ubiquinone/menaquinone biosynthesis C-methylase UbiE